MHVRLRIYAALLTDERMIHDAAARLKTARDISEHAGRRKHFVTLVDEASLIGYHVHHMQKRATRSAVALNFH